MSLEPLKALGVAGILRTSPRESDLAFSRSVPVKDVAQLRSHSQQQDRSSVQERPIHLCCGLHGHAPGLREWDGIQKDREKDILHSLLGCLRVQGRLLGTEQHWIQEHLSFVSSCRDTALLSPPANGRGCFSARETHLWPACLVRLWRPQIIQVCCHSMFAYNKVSKLGVVCMLSAWVICVDCGVRVPV